MPTRPRTATPMSTSRAPELLPVCTGDLGPMAAVAPLPPFTNPPGSRAAVSAGACVVVVDAADVDVATLGLAAVPGVRAATTAPRLGVVPGLVGALSLAGLGRQPWAHHSVSSFSACLPRGDMSLLSAF